MTIGPLSEQEDDAGLSPAAERRVGSNPSGTTDRLSMKDRKQISVLCPNCGKELKNCFALAPHLGFCTGKRNCHHFNGKRAWNRGKTKFNINDVLCNGSRFSTGYVKNFLLKNELITYECTTCKLHEWQCKRLVLELDHINGDSLDHRIENLRLLCPNCHSQTPTFRGRNIARKIDHVSDVNLMLTLNETPSIRLALISVGLAPKGGNYNRCYQLLRRSLTQQE